MSNSALFLIGLVLTIPATMAIGGLVLAAIADGRDNDGISAQSATENQQRR